MHQFYCRAQRWSEPRREAAAAAAGAVVGMGVGAAGWRERGADEEGVKCSCT